MFRYSWSPSAGSERRPEVAPVTRGEIRALRPRLLEGVTELRKSSAQAGEIGEPANEPMSPEELTDSLLRYTEELFRFNEKLGLVEAEPEAFVYAHLLDSLAPLYQLPPEIDRRLAAEVTLIDVGSGAGLPGIPIALARPQLRVTLLDRSGRRCGFLRNSVAMLRRGDIEVVQGDLSTAGERLSPHRLLTARAFRPLGPDIYRRLCELLEADGVMVLYKGRLKEAEGEAESLLADLRAAGRREPAVDVLALEVPGLRRERCVTLIRKCV